MLLDDPHPKKRAKSVPLFKKKLNVQLTAPPSKTDCILDKQKSTADEETTAKEAIMQQVPPPTAAEAKREPNNTKPTTDSMKWKIDDSQLAIQKLLSIAKQRSQMKQENLSLVQLKRLARQKAKAKKSSRRVQPRRKKGKKNVRRSKSKSPASTNEDSVKEEEPTRIVEMETGVLYLYRGDNPRAEFKRRYSSW